MNGGNTTIALSKVFICKEVKMEAGGHLCPPPVLYMQHVSNGLRGFVPPHFRKRKFRLVNTSKVIVAHLQAATCKAFYLASL